MLQELGLNTLLLLYLFLVVKENDFRTKKISINRVREIINSLSRRQILLFLAIPLSIVYLLIMNGNKSILSIYIYTALGSLLLFHALWFSRNLTKKSKILIFLFSILVFIVRLLYPTVVSHNVFILLVVSGLGPLITSFRFFSKKVFISIALVWFCYDIFYIWLSSGYELISEATNAVDFPLSIFAGNSSIGLADLFFASLLVSMINKLKYKILAIIILIASNIGLSYFVYNVRFLEVFPLLVLWVPLGLLVLVLDTRHSRHIS